MFEQTNPNACSHNASRGSVLYGSLAMSEDLGLVEVEQAFWNGYWLSEELANTDDALLLHRLELTIGASVAASMR